MAGAPAVGCGCADGRGFGGAGWRRSVDIFAVDVLGCRGEGGASIAASVALL